MTEAKRCPIARKMALGLSSGPRRRRVVHQTGLRLELFGD